MHVNIAAVIGGIIFCVVDFWKVSDLPICHRVFGLKLVATIIISLLLNIIAAIPYEMYRVLGVTLLYALCVMELMSGKEEE